MYVYAVVEEEDTDHLLGFAKDKDWLRIILKTEKTGGITLVYKLGFELASSTYHNYFNLINPKRSKSP